MIHYGGRREIMKILKKQPESSCVNRRMLQKLWQSMMNDQTEYAFIFYYFYERVIVSIMIRQILFTNLFIHYLEVRDLGI